MSVTFVPNSVFLTSKVNFVGASLTLNVAPVTAAARASGFNYSLGNSVTFDLPPVPPGAGALVFTTYSDSRLFAATNTTGSVASAVIDVVITGADTSVLDPPARFRLMVGNSTSPVRCVYYDVSNNAWSSAGVTTLSSSGLFTQCSTTHLTNFAVLLVSPGVLGDMATWFFVDGLGTFICFVYFICSCFVDVAGSECLGMVLPSDVVEYV